MRHAGRFDAPAARPRPVGELPTQRLPFTPTALVGTVDETGRLDDRGRVGDRARRHRREHRPASPASADANSGNADVLLPLNAVLASEAPRRSRPRPRRSRRRRLRRRRVGRPAPTRPADHSARRPTGRVADAAVRRVDGRTVAGRQRRAARAQMRPARSPRSIRRSRITCSSRRAPRSGGRSPIGSAPASARLSRSHPTPTCRGRRPRRSSSTGCSPDRFSSARSAMRPIDEDRVAEQLPVELVVRRSGWLRSTRVGARSGRDADGHGRRRAGACGCAAGGADLPGRASGFTDADLERARAPQLRCAQPGDRPVAVRPGERGVRGALPGSTVPEHSTFVVADAGHDRRRARAVRERLRRRHRGARRPRHSIDGRRHRADLRARLPRRRCSAVGIDVQGSSSETDTSESTRSSDVDRWRPMADRDERAATRAVGHVDRVVDESARDLAMLIARSPMTSRAPTSSMLQVGDVLRSPSTSS